MFLTELSQHFELVLYTAASLDYANYFIEQIDRTKAIKHLLTREHCEMKDNYAIKDLRLIGRDLQTTIIVDNIQQNFDETTPDNGIHIEDFTGSFDD